VRLELPGDALQVKRGNAIDALEPDVLLGECNLDLLPQDLGVEQVLDTDTQPRRLVRVAGADAALRGADLEPSQPPFAGPVDRDVPRHDQVRLAGEVDVAARDA